MQTSSLSLLKKEFQSMPQEDLVDLCIRLSKYKKENKELLHYILFESKDEELFMANIREEVEILFTELNPRNLYLAKKGIRKILKLVNKYTKYSGISTTQIELLIHFCEQMNKWGDYKSSTALLNIYEAQIKKIHKAISGLHEDLQYDYTKHMGQLLHPKFR